MEIKVETTKKDVINHVSFNSLNRRTQIVLFYYLVLLLCVPVWWQMTSIEQLPLALDRLDNYALTSETSDDANVNLGLAIPYSSSINLVFNLMNEQGVVVWPAEEAIEHFINPHLEVLSSLHNFDIRSQVSFYSPLDFEPVDGSVPLDEARRFVNPAWKLSGTSTLHLIFYLPQAKLTLAESKGQTFLIPEFGVVHILPPSEVGTDYLSLAQLELPMLETVRQLYTLLGAADGIEIAISDRLVQNFRNSIHTLQAIRRLTVKQPGMKIGKDVQNDVNDAFASLEIANDSSLPKLQRFHASIHALQHSDRAFFNPSMLSLLYFPQEHKYAVYMPLFGPVLVPIFLGAIRIFQEWQNKKKKENFEVSLT